MAHDPLELISGTEARKAFWPTLRRGVGLVRDHRLVLGISIFSIQDPIIKSLSDTSS